MASKNGQSDTTLTDVVRELRSGFAAVVKGLERVEKKVDALGRGDAELRARMAKLETRVAKLERKRP